MSEQKDEAQLCEQARKLSVAEGSAYSVMDGFGLRYITPFAVALGAGNIVIGLLSSLPSLLGNSTQLLTIKAMERWNRKKIVLLSTILQTFFWLPIIAVGIAFFVYHISQLSASIALVLFYTLMAAAGAFGSPAWNSWMRDIVPEKSGDYFGRRTELIGIVALAATLVAGLILDYFQKSGAILIGFSTIFGVAALGRGISSALFTKQYEPQFTYDKTKFFSLHDFVKKMPYNNFGKFVFFTGLMTAAVAIASPFFTVYMLKDLGFENWYAAFTIVVMAPVLSALVFTHHWGKLIDRYGNVSIMKINSIFIVIIPFLWLFVHWLRFPLGSLILFYLIIIELFSGIVWAGFNLASGVFVYHAVTKQRMALCITYNSLINAFFALVGALAGGFLATHGVFGFHPILFVFALSGVVRLIAAGFIINHIQEVEQVQQIPFEKIRHFISRFNPRHLIGIVMHRPGMAVGVNGN